jgi:hypothetical protein
MEPVASFQESKSFSLWPWRTSSAADESGVMRKYMARRGCVEDGRRMITACFARALQRCTGRLYMGFRFIFQAVKPIGKTRNQLIVKDRIRLWKKGIRDLVMESCCALHNFRVRLTPWQPMI